MANTGVREEVVNVALADLLSSRGVISTPELKEITARGGRLPDVVVAHFQGLRVVLEGKLAGGDGQKAVVLDQAAARVEEGLAHIGIAVVYPRSVAGQGSFGEVRRRLEGSEVEIAICTEANRGGWLKADVNRLAELLRRTFEDLIEEDVVAECVSELEEGVEGFSRVAISSRGAVERCARALGIEGDGVDPTSKEPIYSEDQLLAVSRIAGLTVLNALLFQEVLSQDEPRVVTIRSCLRSKDPIGSVEEHWKFVLEQIDYVPIFRVAREILLALPSTGDVEKAIQLLGSKALAIVGRRAALRHDLMGRVFHRLLVEKKYLATFYTSVPAATMLLKLSMNPEEWTVDWADAEQVKKFRLVDLACGTGTLLMAAAEAITDNHVNASTRKGAAPDLVQLHKILMEHVIQGFDVLPSALHLTASTLALRAAAVAFSETHLYALPHGGANHRLGSVEFLRSAEVRVMHNIFGEGDLAERMSGQARVQDIDIPRPRADLCVMNPPFTRSMGGNLLFGSVPADQRKFMTQRLQRLLRGLPERVAKAAKAAKADRPIAIRQIPAMASATAGLGSVFVAVGNESVKEGGRIALVLPKAVLSGVAWKKTRQLLANEYQLEYIVASHEPDRWNFSENTDLSEVLLVARKVGPAGTEDGVVTAVNLWQNPRTSFEAMNAAHALTATKAPDVELGQGSLEIQVGGRKAGEALSIPWSEVKKRSWMPQAAFAQADLVRCLHHLFRGDVYVPGRDLQGFIPLTQLRKLGELGPDRRDIWDGFEESSGRTTYPALWGHVEKDYVSMSAEPNHYLTPLPQARPRRPLRKAVDLWAKAGRVVLAERLWLKTNRQIAVRAPEPVLANVWWPLALRSEDEEISKALMMWLNSSFGLLMALGCREETRGAWVSLKKPTWEDMLVLDVVSLPARELAALATDFNRLASEQLRPFPELANDAVRAEIDRSLQEALDLPDLGFLRDRLACEPVVCLRRLADG